MTPRQRRLSLVLCIAAGVGLAGFLTLRAFRENVTFYFDPTRVSQGQVKAGQRFRLGGMVMKGTLARTPGTLDTSFSVTDFQHSVPVRYNKVLPDLFKEGAGMVADGRLDAQGVFVADEVLAKHDENYMPPALARSLQAGKAASSAEAAPPGAVVNR